MTQLPYKSTEADAEGHRGEFEVWAPGWTKVVIVESKVKDNSAGTGKLLEFSYQKDDGSTQTDRLNIVHQNETAQKIGRGALAKIAKAIGYKGELTNTDVLHGRPFEVKVKIEEFESNTEAGKMLKSNKFTDYRPAQSATASVMSNKVTSGW